MIFVSSRALPYVMAAHMFILTVFAVFLCPGASRIIPEPLELYNEKNTSPDVFKDCVALLQMSANMISSTDTKGLVYEALHSLCQRLPTEQASQCDSQVKTYLTKLLQQSPAHLKPAETCELFGLKKEELPHEVAPDSHLSSKVNGEFSPVCTLCLLVIKKLETLLPQNMTEDAIRKLMEEVCSLIPQSYEQQCDDFVEKYGEQIVEFLISSAAPHTICTLLHLCLMESPPVTKSSPPSDCDSCRTLLVLSRLHVGLNSSEAETSSFLQSVCHLHPNAVPKCEAFVKIYSSQLQNVLGNQMNGPEACERADLCVAVKKATLLGQNPCTWGPSFWCRDVKTAQKCGNQAFCEKFMWKNE